MNRPLRYLTVERVIRLHDMIMSRMNMPPVPLRSAALLESAVLRPRHLAYYEGVDLAQQAAVLAIGISQNQPFLDGNKRTAFISMIVFLEINGYAIDAPPLETARKLVDVAERPGERGQASEDFAAWLRDRLVPVLE